jgi:hypothetical protein
MEPGHLVLGPMVHALVFSGFEKRGRMPAPADEPLISVPGPDPYRVVLVGGQLVKGLGLASHQLGLGGSLARGLQAATAHGVTVEVRGTSPGGVRMMADAAAVDETAHDVLVAVLGATEALRLTPTRVWSRELGAFLDRFGADGRPPLVVVATPRLPRDLDMPAWALNRAQQHIDRINYATEERCLERPGVRFVSPLAAGLSAMTGQPRDYDRMAAAVVPAVAAALAS